MLNLTLVNTFVTLAETGSFVGAAGKLGLAQSTVSLQLKRLEASLGVTLLERNQTGCTPTARGREMLPHARALLRSAERFARAAEGDRITIGCSGNIAAYCITDHLRRFLDTERLSVKWDVVVDTNPRIAEFLSGGAIDFAAMEWPPSGPGIDVRPWRKEAMVVIVPNTHPLAGAGTISVPELLELDFIGGERGSGTGTLLRRMLGRQAAKLKVTRQLSSTEAVKSAVKAGLGCSIVLAGAVRDDVEAGRLSMLRVRDVDLAKTLCVAVRSGLPKDALPVRLGAFLAA